jgi:hypothetical protein
MAPHPWLLCSFSSRSQPPKYSIFLPTWPETPGYYAASTYSRSQHPNYNIIPQNSLTLWSLCKHLHQEAASLLQYQSNNMASHLWSLCSSSSRSQPPYYSVIPPAWANTPGYYVTPPAGASLLTTASFPQHGLTLLIITQLLQQDPAPYSVIPPAWANTPGYYSTPPAGSSSLQCHSPSMA